MANCPLIQWLFLQSCLVVESLASSIPEVVPTPPHEENDDGGKKRNKLGLSCAKLTPAILLSLLFLVYLVLCESEVKNCKSHYSRER